MSEKEESLNEELEVRNRISDEFNEKLRNTLQKKKISFKSANREIYGSKSKKTKNPVGKKQPIINILREGPVAKKRKRD